MEGGGDACRSQPEYVVHFSHTLFKNVPVLIRVIPIFPSGDCSIQDFHALQIFDQEICRNNAALCSELKRKCDGQCFILLPNVVLE